MQRIPVSKVRIMNIIEKSFMNTLNNIESDLEEIIVLHCINIWEKFFVLFHFTF